MFRARNRFRRRLLIKSGDREGTVGAVHAETERLIAERVFRDITLSVDVDPQ
jgi:primosomal protein N'